MNKRWIDRIDEKYFEWAGTLLGCFASVLIVVQIREELASKLASTLSPLYLAGFLAIYLFWTFYGFKFRRSAIWVANSIASVLQALLFVIVAANL